MECHGEITMLEDSPKTKVLSALYMARTIIKHVNPKDNFYKKTLVNIETAIKILKTSKTII